MIKGKTFLAIIPARGGSKRLPGKNLINLNGKPLIAWTVEAALKSAYIDKVVVTSNDSDILNASQYYGADVIIRPDYLATDTSTTFGSIKHVLENLKMFDFVILLQPTSPLRNEIHIDQAIELLVEKDAAAIVSVCEVDHSPLWSNTIPHDQSLQNFLKPEVINRRSQDLEIYYRINGAIYICCCEQLLDTEGFFIKDNIFAYEMARECSIDIDYKLDLQICSVILDSR